MGEVSVKEDKAIDKEVAITEVETNAPDREEDKKKNQEEDFRTEQSSLVSFRDTSRKKQK